MNHTVKLGEWKAYELIMRRQVGLDVSPDELKEAGDIILMLAAEIQAERWVWTEEEIRRMQEARVY